MRGLSLRTLGVALVSVLLLAGIAAAVTVQVTDRGRTIEIRGKDGDNEVSIDVIPGIANPNEDFYEIHDPDGIPNVPRGCFRFDANTIHCPVRRVRNFDIDLGGGDDILEFGDGIDVEVEADGGPGRDMLEGGDDDDSLFGRGGRDVLMGGRGNDERVGGGGDDVLKPSAGNDRQVGGGGNDRISGGAGNDSQFGGPGRDILRGQGGRDVQNGGPGNDTCVGGPGRDSQRSC